MRDYSGAYEEWRKANVNEAWKRTRALSFYTLISQGIDVKGWEDVFSIDGDKLKIKQKALFRGLTEEEKEIVKNLNA